MNSTLTRRSDGARKHDPRPAVPSVQALPPADATVVPYHTNATVVPYHTNADLTRARSFLFVFENLARVAAPRRWAAPLT